MSGNAKTADAGPQKLTPLWRHPLAEVFAGGDPGSERRLLLTFVRSGLATSESAKKSCFATCHILRKQRSAFVYPVVQARRLADGRLVLAGEMIDGTSLDQQLAHGALSAARAIPIARQICHALDVAHGMGMTHGALCTASVLVERRDGRDDAVRVTDFGLADEVTAEGMGDFEPTLQPLSPELLDDEMIEPRRDIYLLGALMYAMLAGRPVFEGTADEIREGHALRKPEPLDTDAPLSDVVLRCLAKNPDDRYANVREVERALRAAQSTLGIQTPWDDLHTAGESGTWAAAAELAEGEGADAGDPKIPSGPFEIVKGGSSTSSGRLTTAGQASEQPRTRIGSAAVPSRRVLKKRPSGTSPVRPPPPPPRPKAPPALAAKPGAPPRPSPPGSSPPRSSPPPAPPPRPAPSGSTPPTPSAADSSPGAYSHTSPRAAARGQAPATPHNDPEHALTVPAPGRSKRPSSTSLPRPGTSRTSTALERAAEAKVTAAHPASASLPKRASAPGGTSLTGPSLGAPLPMARPSAAAAAATGAAATGAAATGAAATGAAATGAAATGAAATGAAATGAAGVGHVPASASSTGGPAAADPLSPGASTAAAASAVSATSSVETGPAQPAAPAAPPAEDPEEDTQEQEALPAPASWGLDRAKPAGLPGVRKPPAFARGKASGKAKLPLPRSMESEAPEAPAATGFAGALPGDDFDDDDDIKTVIRERPFAPFMRDPARDIGAGPIIKEPPAAPGDQAARGGTLVTSVPSAPPEAPVVIAPQEQTQITPVTTAMGTVVAKPPEFPEDAATHAVEKVERPPEESSRAIVPIWIWGLGGAAAAAALVGWIAMSGDTTAPKPKIASADRSATVDKAAPAAADDAATKPTVEPKAEPEPEPSAEAEPEPEPPVEPDPPVEANGDAPPEPEPEPVAPPPEPEPEPAAAPEPEPATPPKPEPKPASTKPKPKPKPSGPSPSTRARELTAEGKQAFGSGRTAEAKKLLKQALALDGKRHDAAALLGKIHFSGGDYSGAVTYFRKAIQRAPSKSDYRISLGDALFKKGQYTEAKMQYDKAKKLGHPKAASRIAKVQKKTG